MSFSMYMFSFKPWVSEDAKQLSNDCCGQASKFLGKKYSTFMPSSSSKIDRAHVLCSLPSLKLRARPPENRGWKTILSFWCSVYVSFREGTYMSFLKTHRCSWNHFCKQKKTQLTIYINNFPPAVLYRASKSGWLPIAGKSIPYRISLAIP